MKLLLPALIPSWRFFEDVQPSPRVEWCYEGTSAWQSFRPRPKVVSIWQMIGRLFWNPDWNETLYSVSLAVRLSVEPTSHAEIELIRLIACHERPDPTRAILFRLVFVTRETAEITYQSQPHAFGGIQ